MSFDLTGVFPMAKSVLSGIVIVYVLLLAAERIEAAVGREEREVASHRLPGCAEMACYSLLQLSGTDVRLMEVSERFRQRVPDFDPTKVSILELRHIASSFGVETDAIRMSPQRFSDLPVPCIIYFRPDRWRRHLSSPTGHFLTVAHIGDETLKAFDWDSINPDPVLLLPVDSIRNAWDGEAIVPRKSKTLNGRLIVAILLASIAVAAVMKAARLRKLKKCMLFCGAAAFSSITGCGQRTVAIPTESIPIVFATPTTNLGIVKGTGPLKVKFPFTVWNHDTVQIVGTSKTCNCAAVNEELIGQDLEPGSKHELIVNLTPSGTPAHSEVRIIQVMTDPPASPPIHIAVTYRLLSHPVLSVKELIVDGKIGEVVTAQFEMTCHRATSDQPVKVVESKCEWGLFSLVNIKYAAEEFHLQGQAHEKIVTDRTEIQLRANPSRVYGESRAMIRLYFDDQSSVQLFSVVRIQHPFRLSLKRGFCGRRVAGEDWSISMPYRWDGKEGQVDRIECSIPGSRAELTEEVVAITGTAPNAPGRFEGEIAIYFRDATLSRLTVPISGVVVGE